MRNVINASTLIEKAKLFATKAHNGQLRKYTDAPYITHPIAVASIVASVTDDETVIAAALLHDTVEDTEVELCEVSEKFGTQVAELVRGVTNISKPEDGNRATRKTIDREHIASASADAKTIKLADMIHNTETIAQYDPAFAKVYMAEKNALLGVLKEGNCTLYKRAQALINNYYNSPVP